MNNNQRFLLGLGSIGFFFIFLVVICSLSVVAQAQEYSIVEEKYYALEPEEATESTPQAKVTLGVETARDSYDNFMSRFSPGEQQVITFGIPILLLIVILYLFFGTDKKGKR